MLKWCFLMLSLPGYLISMPPTDSLAKATIKIGYGIGLPYKQLSNRFGSFGVLNLVGAYRIGSFETGPSIKYMFGSTVKEDVLAPLRSREGDLIGSDHQLADVSMRMRGMMLGASVEKSFRLNALSQILLGIEPGWLVHWIRFQDQGNTFEPIAGSNRNGYDRLAAGLYLSGALTYRYSSLSRLINFEFSLSTTRARTDLRRNIQFDQPTYRFTTSSDGLMMVTAKWLIPIFSKINPDKIYY